MSRPTLESGKPAPNVTFQGEHDEPIALSDLCASAERAIVLGFLRHYG